MKRLLTLVLLAILLAVPSGARADVAPPAQPPGSNLQPGVDITQVRMLAETVVLDVQPGASDKSLGRAHVTADFIMHNLGSADESMAARFPIGATNGFSSVNEISDLQIKVAGRPVATRRITGEDPYNSGAPVPWAEFNVMFPAGQDVPIRVDYNLEASGEYPFIWFKYILSTGAGWKDSIGTADIVVRLPYDVNAENVLLDTDQIWFGTTKGGSLAGKTIQWHYANLEPTTENNFEVNLVMPSAWERLLTEQDNVTLNPRDGEAWGRLGRLCKQMAFSSRGKGFRSASTLDPGGAELYELSLQAYEKAVTLLPNDALWHAGYADLLGYHAYFEGMVGTNTDEEVAHSLREIQIAAQLAPNDPQVRQISEEIASFFPNGRSPHDFQVGLTAMAALSIATTPPTELSQALATAEEPTVSASSPPSVAITAQETAPSSRPAFPICGSIILLPLLGIWFALLSAGGTLRPK
jgi:tetratricopeptide (TPR) repeat protein